MPDKLLYEYAVMRVVPKVEREEFINVGVILYARQGRILLCRYQLNHQRLLSFCPSAAIEMIEANLLSFEKICKGEEDSGPIGKLDVASRFRWLTATRSTIIQTAKVHPGLCTNATETIEKLFTQLVLD